jgi:hypothetical protein
MTKEQSKDLGRIVLSTIQMQSVIHTLDQITGENGFKQKKKKEYNDFINYVKKFLDKQGVELYDLTADLVKCDHVVNFFDCVAEFDKVAEEMRVIFNTEKL